MTTEETKEVNAVLIKLPPFWRKNAAVWFAGTEHEFVLKGITSDATNVSQSQ